MSNTKAFKPDDAHAQIRALEARISKLERSQRSGHASIVSASVAADDTITRTTYGDLAHVGPSVSFPVGATGDVIVLVGAQFGGSEVENCFMGFEIRDSNGDVAHSPSDSEAIASIGGFPVSQCQIVRVTGLDPAVGPFTATAKYKATDTSSTSVETRSITVIP